MITIYTDGSARFNGKPWSPGTCAFIVTENEEEVTRDSAYYESGATNNRMEMTAVLAALRYCLNNNIEEAHIITDSELVRKCYLNIWKRKANLDLWDPIMELKKKLPRIKITWTKGHADNSWNNAVDKLCTETYP